ncbi:hypothetical protein G7Z17_g1788 [Cylindrodendrum hubeiense]|uniref:Peptidase S33 tripeptidyl aminopeptidase-like C-terminal domain-containing protein n=1 Tax=Cylindrodendrum hubeiense TaxID=595255 RepID=A0A9P5LJT5_9HYPO|nr:hypothetical protein G7Z17_g1788 [Cylindrodendrum hubeiense]
MKPSNAALCSLLLGSAQAVALPNGDVASLISSRSSTLDWAPCDLDFPDTIKAAMTEEMDCATLKVPLDYTSPSPGKTIELQLIRTNANKKPFKGSVLYNPGGPGASGVEEIAQAGPPLRHIFGGQFSLIGFDPRADETQPSNSSTLSRRSTDVLPQFDTWKLTKNVDWETWGDYADKCFENQQKIGQHINTPFVARDMLSIVDALGEDGKLRYWGVSYGTVLGHVFASMFPDRIDRMLLDSVLLADDYATSGWITSQRDTKDALFHFFDECVEAGPSACSLANYSGSDTTAKDLRDALVNVFDELGNNYTLPSDSGLSEDRFPYGGESILQLLKFTMLKYLYNPRSYLTLDPFVSNILNYNWAEILKVSTPSEDKVQVWNKGSNDAVAGISCSDSSFRAESPEDLYSIIRANSYQSSSFGDASIGAHQHCSRWRFDAAERIDANKLRSVNTSFPVFIINGIYDPVTPASSAWETSVRLKKSRVLLHEGVGHGSVNHPSKCINEAIKKYFVDGELPELGTVCKPDMSAYDYLKVNGLV